MSDGADYWRDVKAHFRNKKNKHTDKISPLRNKLTAHPDCKVVGDHWRIGKWDFWYTGTVMNPRTKEYSTLERLIKENF